MKQMEGAELWKAGGRDSSFVGTIVVWKATMIDRTAKASAKQKQMKILYAKKSWWDLLCKTHFCLPEVHTHTMKS